MKNKIGYSLLVFALMVVMFLSNAFTVFASIGGDNDFTKTVRWVDKENGVASIELCSNLKSNGIQGKILFLGTMSNENGFNEKAIKTAIDTCAQYADVDYHLFRTKEDLSHLEYSEGNMNNVYPAVIRGSVSKLKTDDDGHYVGGFNTDNVKCDRNSYSTVYDFARVISDKLDPKSSGYVPYDYVVMQFDGLRMGMLDVAMDANNSNSANLLNAAIIMRELYSQNKVAWIICDKDNSYPEYNGLGMESAYMYNDYYIRNSNSNINNRNYSNNVYDALALIAPEDWLDGNSRRTFDNGSSQYPSDFGLFYNNSDNLKVFRERTASGSDERVWETYGEEDSVSAFINEKMTVNAFDYVKITDVVKDGFIIRSVRKEVYVNDKDNPGYRELINDDINKWDNNNKKVVARFNLNELDTSRVKLVIEIVVDKNNNPFNQADLAYTNEGMATAEYGCNYDGVRESKEAEAPYLKKVASKVCVRNRESKLSELIDNMNTDSFVDYVKTEMLSF